MLFKILDISKDASIRSNIVIALGDVAVSFSSIIDENSNELYKGLSDKDMVVKKNTLMVLTHLILNGMIKVKGQLGEMGAVDWADGMLATCADDGTVRVWRPDLEVSRQCRTDPDEMRWNWAWSTDA